MRERGVAAGAGRQLGEAGAAEKGRPLGAVIHVEGIDKTMSASSTFGDFYRWSHFKNSPCVVLNFSVKSSTLFVNFQHLSPRSHMLRSAALYVLLGKTVLVLALHILKHVLLILELLTKIEGPLANKVIVHLIEEPALVEEHRGFWFTQSKMNHIRKRWEGKQLLLVQASGSGHLQRDSGAGGVHE